MQVKRLEAYGFKTFADKIEVDFDKGITAIVGPNGSGKSNISDAIKWVLGEQNVRNIRGTKAEDVIFNGSSARRPMGVAEVSLVFDNDGTLPVDFQEVIITRRLFRNGDSEFYINKSRCRLKDITNLFADTGIGHDSMGIISQNKIDAILNARPEERRLFFEEAAGITKYRNRKRESMRKLEDTEANLLRVQDIIGEIENRLEPLQLSAEKTEKYNALQIELKKFNLAGIYLDYLALTKKRDKHRTAIEAKQDQETAAKTALQLSENRKEQYNKVILELEKEQESVAQRRNEVHGQIEAAESEIKVLEERRRQGKAARRLLSQQMVELNSAVKEAQADIEAAGSSETESKAALADVVDQIKANREKAKKLRESLQAKRDTQQKIQQDFQGKSAELNQKNSELMVLERDLASDSQLRDEQRAQLDTLNRELFAKELELKRRSADLATAEGEQRQQTADLRQLEEQLRRDKESLADIIQRKAQQDSQLQKITSRLQIMEKLQQSYEGFGKAVKQVLKSEADWRSGVCGTVAELMTVPGKYITAVETALGSSLQNIVTKDTDTAKAAIEFLKQAKAGRVTFLPLSDIVPKKSREQLPGHMPGIVGWGSEIVSAEPMYKPVVEFLLGRTLIVDTLDNAIALNRHMGQRLRIVTLEGELLSPGGAMTGGSHQHRESSFLNRQGEIQQLREELGAVTQSVKELDQQKTRLEQTIEVNDKDMDSRRTELHNLELQVQEYQLVCQSLTENIDKDRDAQRSLQETLANAQADFAALEARVGALREAISQQDGDNKALSDQLQALTDEYDQLDREADELAAHTNQLEHEQTVYEQNLLLVKEKTLLRQRELDRNQETIGQNQQEIHRLDDELEQSQTQIGQLLTRIQQLQNDFAAAKKDYNEVYNNRMNKLVESQKNEKETREAQNRLNEIQAELHKLEMDASHTEYDLDQLQQHMLSEHGILPERAAELVPEMEPPALKRELKRLEREIEALGLVNPNAPAEYQEQLERHDFLSGNAADLVAAKGDLLKIIGEMDATMTTQFTEAFHQINAFFGDIFVRLFGGGMAKITLTDKENVLESGVDIMVQVPGKKQQNLAVLSGGERALTVVALLFSFLQYRPAPFSLLDEIDAPLDEANIGRYGSFLEEYADNTQFIVVTHRKGTMEVANSMYGVTVEDAGVSKILSVKLKDAESYVDN